MKILKKGAENIALDSPPLQYNFKSQLLLFPYTAYHIMQCYTGKGKKLTAEKSEVLHTNSIGSETKKIRFQVVSIFLRKLTCSDTDNISITACSVGHSAHICDISINRSS